MATTTTTTSVMVKRRPDGRIVSDSYWATTPAECAQRASLNGIGDHASAWQTTAWKKAIADAFWDDPLHVAQGGEDPNSMYDYDVLVMRKVVTEVDDPDVRSTETRYESITP